jgi:hypothetical protein
VGGVSTLQRNFYIASAKSRKGPAANVCLLHSPQQLRLYCEPCERFICSHCQQAGHQGHKTLDRKQVVSNARHSLKADQQRLERAVETLMDNVDTTTRQQQEFLRRRQDAEKAIRDRHAAALAQELAAMTTANEKEEAEIEACLKQQQDGLNSLLQLQQQVERAVATGSGNDVMVIAKEMNSGCGSVKAVRKLTSLKTLSSITSRISSIHNIISNLFMGLIIAFLGVSDDIMRGMIASLPNIISHFKRLINAFHDVLDAILHGIFSIIHIIERFSHALVSVVVVTMVVSEYFRQMTYG